jgi:hypothetical protein
MRKFALLLFVTVQYCFATAQDTSYYLRYLPRNVTYDTAVPSAFDIIGHEVGEWHVTHDRLVNYMTAVAKAAPGRVKLEIMGYTYERRPQILLIITSPRNQQRLEAIRKEHLLLSDPSTSSSVNIDSMPIVVYIGHSIHGNESSGANASMLTAYYLAAAQGREIDELLDNTVILLDPSFNPDGLQRFSTWANQHKSKNLVPDPNSREFNEVWPGGRFNHYWFDLNRDWLPAVHVESQNRLRWFHKWKPNILTDHHEQGSNATFFFQPGVPSRVNPLTPQKNIELTAKLGEFHARFLDSIGSFYFTKENYDDFYYGKGSTYPDINGAIGILFEQASSRGHLQQTNNGLLSFPFTIRNQFVTALSTLEGAKTLRKEFLQWQRDFYKSALMDAAADPVKAYVFDKMEDLNKGKLFVEMLLRQQIKVYELRSDIKINSKTFKKEEGFVVPLSQTQYRVIKTIFSKTLEYRDSLFYDITSWTMPLAFGLLYGELSASQYKPDLLGTDQSELYSLGNRYYTGSDARIKSEVFKSYATVNELMSGAIRQSERKEKAIISKSDYGYVLKYDDFLAPAALYELQSAGLITKVATRDFKATWNSIIDPRVTWDKKNNVPVEEAFKKGDILIPVNMQSLNSVDLFKLVRKIAIENSMFIYPLMSGYASGDGDVGSSKFVALTKPSIAMIVGTGVNATDAGEVWHLLDQRMNIPATHLESAVFNRVELNRYNTIIMVGGTYPDISKEKLRSWVNAGGTLILTEEAVTWASENGISKVTLKKTDAVLDSTKRISYESREQVDGAQQMSGAIFGADVDLSHPLAYGYSQPTVSLFKANKVYMERSKNPYATPFYYGDNPLQSGWVSKANANAIKNSAAVIVNTVGSGRVINITDNPNFRAFWLGGTKLFMNAIFFGKVIDAASGKTE